jgi:hypothetical protein
VQSLRHPVASVVLALCTACVVFATSARTAWARIDFDADSAPIDVSRGPIELGSGFDARLREPRGEPGSCVQDIGTERAESTATHYSIVSRSRVGGRLVIGVHVGTQVAVEALASPRMTDAARRLAGSDEEAFRDLCGDGFVVARAFGGQWIAELEVQGAEAVRAFGRLQTGTWSESEPFREALERLAASGGMTARELPNGDRAAARALTMTDVVEQSIAFPASVPADVETVYYAIFSPYSEAALSGMTLPDAEEIDPRDLARLAFRDETSSERANAAARAAEMRKAVVQRERHDFAAVQAGGSSVAPVVEPSEVLEVSLEDMEVRLGPSIGMAIDAELPATEAGAPPTPASSTVHKVAALVYAEPGAPPVYATTSAPSGLYAVRVRQRSYWVPGAAQASSAVVDAIEKAKAATPSSGTTVVVVERGGGPPVVLTDSPPIDGIFAAPAGALHAWIAGVAAPSAAQRAAIDAAVAIAP